MAAPASVSAASFWKPLDEGFDFAREGHDVDRRGWEVRLLDSRADLGSKLVAASAPFDPPGLDVVMLLSLFLVNTKPWPRSTARGGR